MDNNLLEPDVIFQEAKSLAARISAFAKEDADRLVLNTMLSGIILFENVPKEKLGGAMVIHLKALVGLFPLLEREKEKNSPNLNPIN